MADENLPCHLWPQTPAVTWNGLPLKASRTTEETPFPAAPTADGTQGTPAP